MKARPINFNTPMIQALLDGRKTQTRRVVKGGALDWLYSGLSNSFVSCSENALCPFGKVGDLLWVKEAWRYAPQKHCYCPQGSEPEPCDDWQEGQGCRSYANCVLYAADDEKMISKRRSIHMPRRYSRLTLEITNIRVERLHEISEDDARAEGVITEDWDEWRDDACSIGLPAGSSIENERDVFRDLWKSIHGHDAWEENPFVWALTFNVHQMNVDQFTNTKGGA